MRSNELGSLEEHEHIPLLVKINNKDDRKQVEYLREIVPLWPHTSSFEESSIASSSTRSQTTSGKRTLA